MPDDFQVTGSNDKALFSLVIHRGEGMVLLAMDWKKGKPPLNFVGFGIEYKEPGGDVFFAVKNRLCFPTTGKQPNALSSLLSPIQKFRWVHFPRHADTPGAFTYRVTPVFMNDKDELSNGEAQTAPIVLNSETYPGALNVAFTRGFVSSQAFIDKYGPASKFSTLIPAKADDGLDFKPTHPKADEALEWMGFEARDVILAVLDEAIKDPTANVCAIAYDLNEPEIVDRLVKLKGRLRVIVDDSGSHGADGSAENAAAKRLAASAGAANVKRQHMGDLQHNKSIIVTGAKSKAIGGSTNYSWRGFFVQNNNAVVVQGEKAVAPFLTAFESYWTHNDVAGFASNPASAKWTDLGIDGVDAKITFSPHNAAGARLAGIAQDIGKTTSSLLFSLAFLYQTKGPIQDAIKAATNKDKIFVFGISGKAVGGLDVKVPNGNQAVTFPTALLAASLPQPFKAEASGGSGVHMHHKFVVIDFDKPTARVYLGSYNFSAAADTKNGENLLVISDRRVATSYMVEAIRIFDHYHFRVAQQQAKERRETLELVRPPRNAGDVAWWDKYYTDPAYVNDRKLFSRVSGDQPAPGSDPAAKAAGAP